MAAKRILIFSLVYYPRFVGGAEVAVKEITDRIPPAEIEFDMVTLGSSGESDFEKIGNVNIYRVGNINSFLGKVRYIFQSASKARELNKNNKYNATWSIMASYAGLAATSFKKNHPDIPFLLTLQEGDHISLLKRIVFRGIFKWPNRIQAISKYLAGWAKEMGATAPTEVIPNGVDLKKFGYGDAHLDKSKKTIITTSRLEKKNAVDVIIDSLEFLPENYRVLILGTGNLERELKEQAKKYPGRVTFKGFVEADKIASYIRSSDVFVRPSRSEGLGNSFLEAMACGVPVVGTKVGGIPDFLTDLETGLFTEVDDPKDLAAKIKLLDEDQVLRAKIIDNAEKMVCDKYDWNQIAPKMQAIFESVINSK